MKVGRNDPCPCGSGKKYKRCCLLKDEMADLRAVAVAKFGPEETPCAVCGETVHLLGYWLGDNEVEPDGGTVNIGGKKVAVHMDCMSEFERQAEARGEIH